MRSITIASHAFDIGEPYVEGHVLSAIEAGKLNQLRGENIANNMRKAVKEADEAGNLNAMAAEITTYDESYEFTTVSAGGRGMSQEEREARSIARASIKKSLAEESPARKLKDIDPDKLEALLSELAERDDVVKIAKKRVADKQKIVATSMEGLTASL